jgi:hypothetical protein
VELEDAIPESDVAGIRVCELSKHRGSNPEMYHCIRRGEPLSSVWMNVGCCADRKITW